MNYMDGNHRDIKIIIFYIPVRDYHLTLPLCAFCLCFRRWMELSLFHQLREHFEFFWIFIFRCHWAILSMTKPPRQIESCERNFLHNFRCCNFSAFIQRLTVAFAVENAMEKLENAQHRRSVKQTRSHWEGGGKAWKIFCRCNEFFSLSQSNNHCVLFLIFSPQTTKAAVGTKQWKFSTFSEIEV